MAVAVEQGCLEEMHKKIASLIEGAKNLRKSYQFHSSPIGFNLSARRRGQDWNGILSFEDQNKLMVHINLVPAKHDEKWRVDIFMSSGSAVVKIAPAYEKPISEDTILEYLRLLWAYEREESYLNAAKDIVSMLPDIDDPTMWFEFNFSSFDEFDNEYDKCIRDFISMKQSNLMSYIRLAARLAGFKPEHEKYVPLTDRYH